MAATNSHGETGWARWLRAQLRERDWQAIEITNRTDGRVASSQMTRWLDSTRLPRRASVLKVCEALDVPATEGLIAAGLVDPTEVGATVVESVDLSRAPDWALLDEIGRRLALRHPTGVAPDGDNVPGEQPTVSPIRPVPVIRPRGKRGSDWAARPKPE